MKKRLLSLVLALCMAAALLPATSLTAFAGKKATTLYFGQNSTNPAEYFLYMNEDRTENYYNNWPTTWSVSWNEAAGLPQLNLNGFTADCTVQMDCPCVVEVTGTNTLNSTEGAGLVIAEGAAVTFTGTGSLSLAPAGDALTVNGTAILNGPAVSCASTAGEDLVSGEAGLVQLAGGTLTAAGSQYPGQQLYLAQKTGGSYALYADEALNIQYTAGCDSQWTVTQEQAGETLYAALNLTGELAKDIRFIQNETQPYVAVLRVLGQNTAVGGLNMGEATLTVQGAAGNQITVNGGVTAQNLYLAECDGITFTVVDGDIASVDGTGEVSVAAADAAAPTVLELQNGGILFPQDTVTAVNSTLSVKKIPPVTPRQLAFPPTPSIWMPPAYP